MPTLSAMFRLMDGYSSSIKKILDNTDKAAASIFKASKETDKYNDTLKRTASSADVASAGLSRLIGTVASLALKMEAAAVSALPVWRLLRRVWI